jgi:hypothetical protein
LFPNTLSVGILADGTHLAQEQFLLEGHALKDNNDNNNNNVICRPISSQRLGKHIPAATNMQATIG